MQIPLLILLRLLQVTCYMFRHGPYSTLLYVITDSAEIRVTKTRQLPLADQDKPRLQDQKQNYYVDIVTTEPQVSNVSITDAKREKLQEGHIFQESKSQICIFDI